MQQLEVLKERSNDKMVVLFFYGKRFPASNQIKIRLAELAIKMKHLIMTWSDLDIDKEVVQHFEIKTAPFIILVHVSLPTFA